MTWKEKQAFLDWFRNKYGANNIFKVLSISTGEIGTDSEYYKEWIEAGRPGFETPSPLSPEKLAEIKKALGAAGGLEPEPEAKKEEEYIIWFVPPYNEGGIGPGAIYWSDGDYTEALPPYRVISESQALQWKEAYDAGITVTPPKTPGMGTVEYDESGLPIYVVRDEITGAIISQEPLPPGYFEKPVLGNYEVVSVGGWDIFVTLDEAGKPTSYDPIGKTEDKGMDDYEEALIDIQNKRLEVEERGLGYEEERIKLDRDRYLWDIYEFGNLSAYESSYLAILMKPYEELTVEQKMRFEFDREKFEFEKDSWAQEFGWKKQTWEEEMARQEYEFANLSAWQEAQMGQSQQELALQERMYGAQLQQRPMDWISAWRYANTPQVENMPYGMPNPAAPNQPYMPYQGIGVV